MANIFIWHSASYAESAEELAVRMREICNGAHEITTGTLPPKNFNGFCISLNGSYSDKFDWKSRTFSALFNDPRKAKFPATKKAVFGALREKGVPTMVISDAAGYHFYPAKGEVHPHTAEVKKGEEFFKVTFGPESYRARQRFIFCNNQVVATLQAKKATKDEAIKNLAKDAQQELGIAPDDKIQTAVAKLIAKLKVSDAALTSIVDSDSLQLVNAYNTPENIKNICATIKGIFNCDFFAVDYIPTIGVINVILTPNLRIDSLTSVVAGQMLQWVKSNSLSAREILKKLAEEIEDEETAAEMVAAIKSKMV